MKNVLIINGHEPYSFAPGELNASLVSQVSNFFSSRGAEVSITETAKAFDIEEELEKHVQADFIFYQFPIYWMGPPWRMKKYIDDVYTAGTNGPLCDNDGRSSRAPKHNYGSGGTRSDTKYMLSVTLNAPAEAFDDPNEYLLEGRSLDDLLLPMHTTARFFKMQPQPTFAAFDVIKNPELETDFDRLNSMLEALV